jgi:hypothetical protein
MAIEHLDTSITLDPVYDDDPLCLQVVDRAGHKVNAERRTHVEVSTAYHRVYDAAEEILDVNVDRAPWQIVRAARGWLTTYTMDTVVDESLSMPIALETGAPPTSTFTFGGIYRGKDHVYVNSAGEGLLHHSTGELWAWSLPVMEFVATRVAAPPTLRGDWAAALAGTTAYIYQLSKLGDGALTALGTAESVDVGANGVAAYTTPITGTATSCTGGDLYFRGVKVETAGMKWDVRTDGTLAVYRWQGRCGDPDARIGIYDGAQQTFAPYGFALEYRINHGWVIALFETSGPARENRVWRRSPAGAETIAARPVEFPLLLETLGGDGSFTYLSGATRHLVDAAGNDHAIGGVHGHAYWTSDGWYVVVGRSLFKISTS